MSMKISSRRPRSSGSVIPEPGHPLLNPLRFLTGHLVDDVAGFSPQHNEIGYTVLVSGDFHTIMITPGDPRFPERLLAIPRPPKVLYVAGDPAALGRPGIAVIGTRTPSAWGAKKGPELTGWVIDAGFVIVSGLAAGCDTVAHTAAVERGRPTVAFLPSGLGCIYPPENRELARRIVEDGGCLVSEYPYNARPRDYRFSARDRLQSGLAHGVIVIETDLESGTMVTVGHAEKQGRPIACLNSHPDEYRTLPSYSGNRALLEGGRAFGIKRRSELMSFLGYCGS